MSIKQEDRFSKKHNEIDNTDFLLLATKMLEKNLAKHDANTEQLLLCTIEKKYAHIVWQAQKEQGFKSIEKLSALMRSLNTTYSLPISVVTHQDAMDVMNQLSSFVANTPALEQVEAALRNAKETDVNAVSDTVYALAAMLKAYARLYKNDPQLQQDINHIVTAFVSFECVAGVHSFAQMLEILREDRAVNKLFKAMNIHPHVEINKTLLERAFNAA